MDISLSSVVIHHVHSYHWWEAFKTLHHCVSFKLLGIIDDQMRMWAIRFVTLWLSLTALPTIANSFSNYSTFSTCWTANVIKLKVGHKDCQLTQGQSVCGLGTLMKLKRCRMTRCHGGSPLMVGSKYGAVKGCEMLQVDPR